MYRDTDRACASFIEENTIQYKATQCNVAFNASPACGSANFLRGGLRVTVFGVALDLVYIPCASTCTTLQRTLLDATCSSELKNSLLRQLCVLPPSAIDFSSPDRRQHSSRRSSPGLLPVRNGTLSLQRLPSTYTLDPERPLVPELANDPFEDLSTKL